MIPIVYIHIVYARAVTLYTVGAGPYQSALLVLVFLVHDIELLWLPFLVASVRWSMVAAMVQSRNSDRLSNSFCHVGALAERSLIQSAPIAGRIP